MSAELSGPLRSYVSEMRAELAEHVAACERECATLEALATQIDTPPVKGSVAHMLTDSPETAIALREALRRKSDFEARVMWLDEYKGAFGRWLVSIFPRHPQQSGEAWPSSMAYTSWAVFMICASHIICTEEIRRTLDVFVAAVQARDNAKDKARRHPRCARFFCFLIAPARADAPDARCLGACRPHVAGDTDALVRRRRLRRPSFAAVNYPRHYEMTSPGPVEILLNALANAYTMLTAHRGFVAHELVEEIFGQWPAVYLLPLGATRHETCRQIYRLGLLDARYEPPTRDADGEIDDPDKIARELAKAAAAREAELNANIDNLGWLAQRTQNLLFARADGPPLHAGINYTLAMIVVTGRCGDESASKLAAAKVAAACTLLEQTVDLARSRGARTCSARLVNIMAGAPGKTIWPVYVANSCVSVEYWYTDELQHNPLKHTLVPTHKVFATMSDEERARIPAPTRAAAMGDSDKLDGLLTTDPISRWLGYVRGQIICIERAALFDGGIGYSVRCVR